VQGDRSFNDPVPRLLLPLCPSLQLIFPSHFQW
jgi:hypothetical protein